MKSINLFFLLTLVTLLIGGCNNSDDETAMCNVVTSPTEPNILLVIMDDVGVDAFPGYDIGDFKPNMPNIDALANRGITFDNVWANPVCSPTRATILTGKYGFHTNVLNPTDLNVLSTNETSLHQYVDQQLGGSHDHCIIGKWHLGGSPRDFGMDYYTGSTTGALPSYTSWNVDIDGVISNTDTYATSFYTDAAINWIDERPEGQPWICWLAYNAPHTPFHLPPLEMHSQGSLPEDEASIDANPLPYFIAMIESIDFEIGRITNSMTQSELDNTTIIVIGDNGTPNQVAQPPYTFNKAKGSLFQGGVHVPMIIAGKNVTQQNTREPALINSTDLFSTILNLAGADITEINNSKSFNHLFDGSAGVNREYIYAEVSDGVESDWTIRNDRYKFMNNASSNNRFYDLLEDPYENTNLLMGTLTADQQAARTALNAAADEIRQ